jgi:hypothetical protein
VKVSSDKKVAQERRRRTQGEVRAVSAGTMCTPDDISIRFEKREKHAETLNFDGKKKQVPRS